MHHFCLDLGVACSSAEATAAVANFSRWLELAAAVVGTLCIAPLGVISDTLRAACAGAIPTPGRASPPARTSEPPALRTAVAQGLRHGPLGL